MRAVCLPLLSFALLAACADPPPPKQPTKAEQPAPKEEAAFAAVTPADCRAWADHFESRLKEANRRRIDECAKKITAAGGTPIATDEKDRQDADAEAERLHALIVEQCTQQVGAMYPRADAQCYVQSKTLEAWKSCPFQSMFFADYKSVARNHAQMFDDRCKTALDKTAAAKGTPAG
ncbi:MAG: hypothetical protein HYV09_01805 [Deltaproteobacteria bacterium]|nr:hypothetical protein [Deltaproteobacteria bacterium]